MARNKFQPVFEETEMTIRDRMIAKVETDGWRAEPGDFMFDAIAPSPAEIKQLQINQDTILASRFAFYAEGSDLDDCLYDVGLTRIGATPNKRALLITADAGVNIPQGQQLYAVVLDDQGQPLKFTADAGVNWATSTALILKITCQTAGTIGNLAAGSQFVLQPSIPGVRIIADQGSTILARDPETDEEAWERYDFKATHPDTGGNKYDLQRWAQEVAGVGKAKVIPRWAGVNTSKVLLAGLDLTPATPQVVTDTQVYLDPGATGLGDGKVPLGNACTVAAADNLAVNITVTGTQYAAGAIPATVKAAFQSSVKAYLKELVFEVDPSTKTPLPVIYNKIYGLLAFTVGLKSFSTLTINGGTADLTITQSQAPTLGTVTGL
jgi:uncharacterized phage protein gp47/JayE